MARCATGLASMSTASATPSTTEMTSPIPTTPMVAGRWARKSGSRSSQSRCNICTGLGRIYCASIPMAPHCHSISTASTSKAAGKLDLHCPFISYPS